MQACDRASSIFGDNDGLEMFIMPGSDIIDHLVGDQFSVSRIAVPSKVAIDADHIEELALIYTKKLNVN